MIVWIYPFVNVSPLAEDPDCVNLYSPFFDYDRPYNSDVAASLLDSAIRWDRIDKLVLLPLNRKLVEEYTKIYPTSRSLLVIPDADTLPQWVDKLDIDKSLDYVSNLGIMYKTPSVKSVNVDITDIKQMCYDYSFYYCTFDESGDISDIRDVYHEVKNQRPINEE